MAARKGRPPAAKSTKKGRRKIETVDDAKAALDDVMDLPSSNRLSDVSERDVADLSEVLREDRDPRPQTIDEVAARHLRQESGPVYHGSRDVPPEARPDRRDGPTLGPVKMIFDDLEITDQSDDRIRSLEDLMARFPFVGPGGDYFIRVVRHAPKTYMGMSCTGVLRKIINALTYEQFVDLYGGGDYELTVYGPPKGPGVYDPATGRVRSKALTQPIRFTVPYDKDGVYGMAPNPSASIPDADENYPMDTPMQRVVPVPGGRPVHPFERGPMRVTTPADAKIHEADLQHEASKEERDRERAEQEAARRDSIEIEKMRMKERAEERALKAERERADAERERRQELEAQVRDGIHGQNVDPAALVRALAEFKGDGSEVKVEMQRQSEAHKNEVTRMMEDQKRELSRLEEAHKRDLERERTLADEKIRMAREEANRERERMDRLVRDAEERAERKAKEAEERADRRVEEVRRDTERQLQVNERMWESRLKDEQRNNERDLTSRKDTHEAMLRTEKVTYDVQLRSTESELTRLRAEVDRLRAELQEKGDVVSQVAKVTEVAEALGFSKASDKETDDDGEEKPATDWKQMAAGIGLNLVNQLPDLLRSAGDAVSAIRSRQGAAPGAQEQQQQEGDVQQQAALPPAAGRRRGFQPRRILTFANENADPININPDLPVVAPAPIYPTMSPATSAQYPAPAAYAPGQALLMQPEPQYIAPEPQMAPRPSAPPPAPQTMAPPPPEVPRMSPEESAISSQIVMFRQTMEEQVESGASAEAFVAQLVTMAGPEAVREYAKVLTADLILAAIKAQPDGAKSSLVKFEGRKWLKAFEAAAKAV